MTINGYKIYPIICEHFWLDGGAMFGTVPKVLWERKHPADEKNRVELVTRSLVIVGDEKVILVDTGIGQVWDEKFKSIYNVSPTTLQTELQKLGLTPSDVSDVIITHLHFDHIGGAISQEADEIQLTFPNAKHHVQKANFDQACNPNLREKASYLKPHFMPIEEARKFVFHEGQTELYPGIKLHVSNAHTRGQQWLTISDEKQTLCYAADLIPTSSHLRLPWVMGYDLYPIELMEEKQALLTQALNENWVICFEHDPLVEAITVKASEKGIVMDKQVKLLEN